MQTGYNFRNGFQIGEALRLGAHYDGELIKDYHGKEVIYIDDCEISEAVNLSSASYNGLPIVFGPDLIFNHEVIIAPLVFGSQNGLHVIIDGSTFRNSLVVSEDVEEVVIKGGTFSGISITGSTEWMGQLKILGGTFNSDIYLGGYFDNIEIKCSGKGNFNIEAENINNVLFRSGDYNRLNFRTQTIQKTTFLGGQYREVVFHPKHEIDSLEIKGGTFKERLLLDADIETVELGGKCKVSVLRFSGKNKGSVRVSSGNFKNVKFEKYQSQEVIISGGDFAESLVFESAHINNLNIDGGTFHEIKLISSSTLGFIHFGAAVVSFLIFNLYPENETKELAINGLQVTDTFDITYFSCRLFTFNHGEIKQFQFKNGQVTDKMCFGQGTMIHEEFEIQGGTINHIECNAGKIEKFNIKEGKIKEATFSKSWCTVDLYYFGGWIGQTRINGADITNYYINRSVTDLVSIEGIVEPRNNLVIKSEIKDLSIRNVHFNRLELGDFDLMANQKISMKSSRAKALTISNFNNYGLMTLNEVKLETHNVNSGKPKIEINNSDLGRLNFISCSFEESEMFVDNTKLTEIFYTNTIVPKTIDSKKEIVDGYFRQLQDTYGQFVSVAKRCGYNVDANNWNVKSNDAHLDELKNDLGRKNRADIINLQVSRLISNYGQSWSRALISIGVIGAVIYPFVVIAADENVHFIFMKPENWHSWWDVILRYSGSFFEFLLPIHRTNFLGLETYWNKQLYVFLDVLGRVSLSYPVYQFIRATRKFTLK
jgi:hypothetical protein